MAPLSNGQIWREIREAAASLGWGRADDVKVTGLRRLCKRHAIVNAAEIAALRTRIDALWLSEAEITPAN